MPVDVLPDRSADTFARWLTEHPGVEVVSRDRSGEYGEAVSRVAPRAGQVTDRFHPWRTSEMWFRECSGSTTRFRTSFRVL
jgi:transposase